MKELWYLIVMLLMLGVLAGFSNMSTPTGAFAANLPPKWDYPSTVFIADGERFELNLEDAFFDPDDDPLSFGVSPGKGVSAGVQGDTLVVLVKEGGTVKITASDGKSIVSQTITVKKN